MMFEYSPTDGVLRGKIWQGAEENEPSAWTHTIPAASMGSPIPVGYPGVSGRGTNGRYKNFTVEAVDIGEAVIPVVIGRNSRIVNTLYDTEDIVVADYDITDIILKTANNTAKIDKTGVEDATPFIQAAIDACFESGGGTVWLPAGNYRVTKSIDVKPCVTLRGDWNPPNADGTVTGGSHGTVIIADVPSRPSDTGGLFMIAGSSGCLGLTVWYPNQQIPSPTSYPYTFEITTGVMANVKNCTMLNSFKGIGISFGTAIHEMATVHNVYGTILNKGLEAYNASEVDVVEWVYFDNKYWVQSGMANAPDQETLDVYTKANTRGFIIGDLEWGQFTKLHANNYNIGLEIVSGVRVEAAINVDQSEFINCATAIKMTATTNKSYWPQLLVSRSTIHGTANAVQTTYSYSILGGSNNRYPVIHLTDCVVNGNRTMVTGNYITRAIVENPRGSGAPVDFDHEAWVITKPAKANLYDVTKTPYNAPFTMQTANETFGIQAGLPTQDATAAIQQALNDAGVNGGGIVYIPAGWYRINGRLIVPAGVELRGSSSVPQRNSNGLSLGTTLMAYEGKKNVDWPAWVGSVTATNLANPANNPSVLSIIDVDPAFITLDGDGAGVRGFKIFWPENPFWPEPFAYPYAIRGNGADLYVMNMSFVNAFKGIDFWTNDCPGHYIRRLSGISIGETIKIGRGSGKIEACLTNLTHLTRQGYGVPGWIPETANSPAWYPGAAGTIASQFWGVFGFYTKEYQTLIYIDGADEKLMNNFSFGARHGVYVKSGNALANSQGFDGNTHFAGAQVDHGASLTIINYMAWSMFVFNSTAPTLPAAGTPPSNNQMTTGVLANDDTFTFYNYWYRRSNNQANW